MSFTSFVVLFHSFVCAHVCGLSGHFPFLFVVPLAYSFIASSLTPHLITKHFDMHLHYHHASLSNDDYVTVLFNAKRISCTISMHSMVIL